MEEQHDIASVETNNNTSNMNDGNVSVSQEHRASNYSSAHHHHHHHHDNYEQHLRRKQKQKRRDRLKKIRNALLIAFMCLSLLILALALLAPSVLRKITAPDDNLDNGVTNTLTTNRHLKLDYDGIDVSHHQGVISWDRVAYDTCVQFVYIKATEGSTIVDKNYLQNVEGAKAAGLNFGSYHYLTSKSSVDDQFRNFYGVVDRRIQKIVPMIDVEEEGVRGWTRQQIQDNLAKMIKLIETHYHVTPIIYSYAKFYNENLAPRFNSYQLFLAHYNVNEPVVAGAGKHNLWQHSDQGIVDGISTPVDIDIFADGTSLKDILMNNPH